MSKHWSTKISKTLDHAYTHLCIIEGRNIGQIPPIAKAMIIAAGLTFWPAVQYMGQAMAARVATNMNDYQSQMRACMDSKEPDPNMARSFKECEDQLNGTPASPLFRTVEWFIETITMVRRNKHLTP